MPADFNNRILIVDDNPSVHECFRKILMHEESAEKKAVDALLSEILDHRNEAAPLSLPQYRVDSAHQGQKALEMADEAARMNDPYALIYMDVRMPPGWDGVETIEHIWKKHPFIEMILCTAFTDYSWEEIAKRTGITDRLMFLRKPFDTISVQQMTLTLVNKWNLGARARDRIERLKNEVRDRTESALRADSESKRVQEINARLATAIEQTVEAIVITDASGAVEFVNPAFLNATGLSREAIVGKNALLLKNSLQDEAFYRDVKATVTSGKVWRGRFVIPHGSGDRRETMSTITPVLDRQGNIVNYAAVFHDVTKENKLEAQLRHSQKMEAIGELAGGVAHDLNNQLTAVLGCLDVIHGDCEPNSRISEAIEIMEKAGQRATTLVQQLLGFARGGKNQNVPFDLHGVVQEEIDLLKRTIDKKIQLWTRFEADNAHTHGDPNQIHQAVMNLAINARDAMPQGGELIFSTKVADLDEEFCACHPGAKPGKYVAMSVCDTGSGMTKEVRERIFEPFFTTKETGKGTGLGLAMVFGIVKNHGGLIEALSEPGVGTEFRVYLPQHAAVQPEVSAKPAPGPIMGTGRVLLIDDEDHVRRVGAAMLGRLGYEVIVASGAKEAAERFTMLREEIDLVILDFIMPDQNGLDCFRTLKRLDPDVKVVLASGFSVNESIQQVLNEGASGFIQKPYSLAQLSLAAAQAMGAAPPS